jgi:hypothetical protein
MQYIIHLGSLSEAKNTATKYANKMDANRAKLDQSASPEVPSKVTNSYSLI